MKLRHAKIASTRRDLADTKAALSLLKSHVFGQKLKGLQRKSLASLLASKAAARSALFRWHYQTIGQVIRGIEQESELQVQRAQQVAESLQANKQSKQAALKLAATAVTKKMRSLKRRWFENLFQSTALNKLPDHQSAFVLGKLFEAMQQKHFDLLARSGLDESISRYNRSIQQLKESSNLIQKEMKKIAQDDAKSTRKTRDHLIRHLGLVWKLAQLKGLYSIFKVKPARLTNHSRKAASLMRVKAVLDSANLRQLKASYSSVKLSAARLKKLNETLKKLTDKHLLTRTVRELRVVGKKVRRAVLLFRRLFQGKMFRDTSDSLWVLRSHALSLKSQQVIELIGYASEGVSDASQELSRVTQENFRLQTAVEKRRKKREQALLRAVFTRVFCSASLRLALHFQRLSYHANHLRKAAVGFGLLSRVLNKVLGPPFRRVCRAAVVEREKFLSGQIKDFRDQKEELELERVELNKQVLGFIEEKTKFESGVPARIARLKTARRKLVERLVARGIHKKCEVAMVRVYLARWRGKQRRNELLKRFFGENPAKSSGYYLKKWRRKAQANALKFSGLAKLYAAANKHEHSCKKLAVVLLLDWSFRKEAAHLQATQDLLEKKLRNLDEARKRDDLGRLVATVATAIAKKPFLHMHDFFSRLQSHRRTRLVSELKSRKLLAAYRTSLLSRYFADLRHRFLASQSEKQIAARRRTRQQTFILALLQANLHQARQARARARSFGSCLQSLVLRRLAPPFQELRRGLAQHSRLKLFGLGLRVAQRQLASQRSVFLRLRGDTPSSLDAASLATAARRVELKVLRDAFHCVRCSAKCEERNAAVVQTLLLHGLKSSDSHSRVKRGLLRFKLALLRLEDDSREPADVLRAWRRVSQKSQACRRLLKQEDRQTQRRSDPRYWLTRWSWNSRTDRGAQDFPPLEQFEDRGLLVKE